MNENATPQAKQEAIEQAKAEKARIARSFAEVFGSPQRRTEAQKTVIDYLKKGCDPDEENAFQFTAKDGIGLLIAGIHRDGGQSIIRLINRKVRQAEEEALEKPKKQKPKSTR